MIIDLQRELKVKMDISECQYLGTGCDSSRYGYLGALVGLSILSIAYGIHQCIYSSEVSEFSRNVIRWGLVAEVFSFGVVVSRFFISEHGWATSVLLICAIASLCIFVFYYIVQLLLKPVSFIGVDRMYRFRIVISAYGLLLVSSFALLIAANISWSLGDAVGYRNQLSAFFACLAMVMLVFAGLIAWVAILLLSTLKQVNIQYDHFAKYAAQQRRRLTKNTIRMVSITCVNCAFAAAVAFAICGLFYSSASVASSPLSIMYFLLLFSLISMVWLILVLFGIKGVICGDEVKKKQRSFSISSSQGHYYENAVTIENVEPFPDMVECQNSLYVRIGGRPVIEKLVRVFYAKTCSDDRVGHFFGQASMELLMKKQEMFMILVTGGPAVYSGRSLREAHAKLNIDSSSFDIVVSHMTESLREVGVEDQYVLIISSRIALFKFEVMGLAGMISDSGAPEDNDERVSNAGDAHVLAKQ